MNKMKPVSKEVWKKLDEDTYYALYRFECKDYIVNKVGRKYDFNDIMSLPRAAVYSHIHENIRSLL